MPSKLEIEFKRMTAIINKSIIDKREAWWSGRKPGKRRTEPNSDKTISPKDHWHI